VAREFVRIRVTGDEELRRRLIAARRALPDGVDEIALDVADLMALYARRKVPLGPGRGGHVRKTLVGQLAGGVATVQGGDAAHPYYGWLEFGGHVGIHRSVAREKVPDGRYIYPTLRERRAEIDDQMSHGLAELIERHGIRVNE
jgi:hypothetical protein